MTTQKRLFQLIKKLSYREGDFTLASGKRSSFYIDLKATTLHPEGAALIGELVVETMLAHRPAIRVDGVGGLTLGADPIATAVSLTAWSKKILWPAFIVRKEPKGHGTDQYIEGVENMPARASLLILEDVVTTGGSSVKAIERIREAGFECSAVLTVVDREQGGREVFESMGVPFLKLATLSDVQSA